MFNLSPACQIAGLFTFDSCRSMQTPWPFDDSPDTACFTTRSVLIRQKPVVVVKHDDEDDCWHFLCNADADALDARVISLREMLQLAPDLVELADLPSGWSAVRDNLTSDWRRFGADDVEST